MTRRHQRRARLVTAFLALLALSACTQPDAGITVKSGSNDAPRYFAASAAGAFLVTGDQAFTVAKPGAEAQSAACCSTSTPSGSTESSRRLFSGSVALEGTPWVIMVDGSAIDLKGKEHGSSPAIRQLAQGLTLTRPGADGKPATTRSANRWVQNRAVSVMGSGAVLAATYTTPGSSYWHANDSVVYRVGAPGAPVAVAGRPGFGTARPVSGLKVGERVPATTVDLERVQALVALDQRTFVLFMIAPAKEEKPAKPRLQAALVSNGQISRLELPDLCSKQNDVVASRVSDHDVVLSALKGTGDCTTRTDLAWVRINTAKNTFTEVGSGDGFVAIAGDQLLTATTKIGPQSLTTVTWQDLPGQP